MRSNGGGDIYISKAQEDKEENLIYLWLFSFVSFHPLALGCLLELNSVGGRLHR